MDISKLGALFPNPVKAQTTQESVMKVSLMQGLLFIILLISLPGS